MSTASNQHEPFALGIITRLQDDADAAIRRVARVRLADLSSSPPTTRHCIHASHGRSGAGPPPSSIKSTVTTHWAHAPGRRVWNFYEGPLTLGLVPPETRAGAVLAALQQAAGLCRMDRRAVAHWAHGLHPRGPERSALSGHCRRAHKNSRIPARSTVSSYGSRPARKPRRRCSARSTTSAPTTSASISIPANLLLYGRANPLDAV